jgi:hypothetical protein
LAARESKRAYCFLRFNGDEAGHWYFGFCNDSLFACAYPLQQAGEVGFGLMDVDFREAIAD